MHIQELVFKNFKKITDTVKGPIYAFVKHTNMTYVEDGSYMGTYFSIIVKYEYKYPIAFKIGKDLPVNEIKNILDSIFEMFHDVKTEILKQDKDSTILIVRGPMLTHEQCASIMKDSEGLVHMKR